MILLFSCISFLVKAQRNDTMGKITIYADPDLEKLIYLRRDIDPDDITFSGWRIQIYAGTDARMADKIEQDIKYTYPDQNVYKTYNPPNVKIRIGDFRNRIEAQSMFQLMDSKYHGVLMVPDKIKFPRL